ncbi:MAG: signal peptide peptidase SppA [Caldimicrobium sp.]
MKRPWLVYGLAFFGGIILFFLLLFFISSFVFFFYESKPLRGDKIAILEVNGVILQAEPYLSALREIKERKDIKAVVLRIDSPGGSVSACQEIFEELKSLKGKKPLIVSMGGVAASGGLYLALAGEKIYVNPGSITGSIGVIIQLPNLEKLMEKIGISTETIKSGEFKDTGTSFRKLTPREKEYLQNLVNTLHSQFVSAVSEERKIPLEQVKAIADGRVFTGEEAIKLKLADEIGNFYKAVDFAKEKARLKDALLVYFPEKKGFVKKLIEGKLPLNPQEILDPYSVRVFYLYKY